MTTYAPPISDMLFNLQHLFHDGAGDADPDRISAVASIIEEGGRFAAEAIAPLNKAGDTKGARLEDGVVVTPPGWKDAYAAYAAGGWIGASIGDEGGGMGLSNVVGACLQEIIHSANMSFALCPMLTQAAIKAIALCGSPQQRNLYLPRLISGEWTGTMVLTEPQAGSDLSAVRTRAEKVGDNYLLRGQKIFITYGDHDLTNNIIHLVLARTSTQESGTKGLSLFIVPKRRLSAGGAVEEDNDVRCVSLEHKLGIHASPTACLALGDNGQCFGELVGEEGRGLEYMFIMMNEARLSVGVQGLAIAERAYQAAAAYAGDRMQGRIIGDKSNARRPIRFHPDVHRMLMQMRTSCEAMRGLSLLAAQCTDLAQGPAPGDERAKYQGRLDLLVPIVKGWCTERACDVASLALQVHGGMGYVEETGVAQHFRDARITTIYEGTTGIQANDLVERKIRRDKGAAARLLLAEVHRTIGELRTRSVPAFEVMHEELAFACHACERAVEHATACSDRQAAAVSVHVLHLFGLTLGAWLLVKGALKADDLKAVDGANLDALREKIASAHFFAGQVLPEARGRVVMITDRSDAVGALYPEL